MWDIMKLPRIEERTLYSPIIDCLHELGFEAVGETKVGKNILTFFSLMMKLPL